MENAELGIFSLNFIIVLVAYFLIYPKVAGSDINKISINDFFASVISLCIVGSVYWGTEQQFNALFMSVNWFWFTLITYAVIEIPFMIWYFKKHKVNIFQ